MSTLPKITSAQSLLLVQDYFGRPLTAVSNGDLERALRLYHLFPDAATYRGEMMDTLTSYLMSEPLELLNELCCTLNHGSAKQGDVLNRKILSAFHHPRMINELVTLLASKTKSDRVTLENRRLPQQLKDAIAKQKSGDEEILSSGARQVVLQAEGLPPAETVKTVNVRGKRRRTNSTSTTGAEPSTGNGEPTSSRNRMSSTMGAIMHKGTFYHVHDIVSLDALDRESWGICPAKITGFIVPKSSNTSAQAPVKVCLTVGWIGTNLTAHPRVREQKRCYIQGTKEHRVENLDVLLERLTVLSQERYCQQFGNLSNQNVPNYTYYYGGEIDEKTNKLTLRTHQSLLQEHVLSGTLGDPSWNCLHIAANLRAELPHFEKWKHLDVTSRVSSATVRATAFQILSAFHLCTDSTTKEMVQGFWKEQPSASKSRLALQNIAPDSLSFLLGPYSRHQTSTDFWGRRLLKDNSTVEVIQVNMTIRKTAVALDSLCKLTVEFFYSVQNEFGCVQTVT
eukprot:GILK01007893.1.p1 GENE.GILK01007893.1~~GILK01007893.1.p1  ORF type:complete len:519 (-),score=45.92 GILK01007893.1:38-1564(-)